MDDEEVEVEREEGTVGYLVVITLARDDIKRGQKEEDSS